MHFVTHQCSLVSLNFKFQTKTSPNFLAPFLHSPVLWKSSETMAVAQKLKEAEVTEQNSLLLTRNLLRIAIFNITYIRGLFPEKYFNDKSVPALEMKIKKLMPVDPESRRLIDWMEKGVYDALQKKYLKTLLFCVCESIEGSMIEEYAFSFSYSSSDSQEVSMNVNRTGNKKQGGTFKCDSVTEITPNQMKSSACKMVRTLVQLMRTLDKMPEERTILMKLLYYEDVTPVDYEPPFFRSCTEEEAHNAWTKNPLKMDVGNVNSKHFVLTLKVKSVLDPCEDENDDIQDNVSLGADSGHRDEFSESDSEVYQSEEDQYMIAPADKQRGNEDTPMVDDDDTQDPAEDEQQLSRIKDWICSWHLDTVELTDILSNFPDISVVLIEEIMENLVKEDFLSKFGRDSYTIKKRKESDYDFSAVKERDCQVGDFADKASPRSDEDYMYMKALYHALPMSYVTVSKLQTKFEGQVKQGTVRKLIEKMSREGYIEAKGNRGLGKRVIHSNLTEQKLNEIKKALDYDTMEVDVDNLEKGDKEIQTMGNRPRDTSTCGGVHSIGSELTRTKGRSDMHENGSIRSEQTSSIRREQVNILTSPTSKEEPLTSRESFAAGKENNSRLNGNTNHCDEVDVICSRGSQEKRSRKASTVKEPILQNMKRQKAVA